MDTVSVVVPVYKVEKYLARCVESLLAQEYPAHEIILVDDGSPDTCPALCDAYAQKYAAVRVLHKQNGGLSDARNAGTLCAAGEYVTFVDSDDWVHPAYLAQLVKARQETQAEIAVCDWFYAREQTVFAPLAPQPPQALTGQEAVRQMLYQKSFTTCAWGKLYPLRLAQQYLYPVGKNCEDLFTTYKLLYAAQRVAYIAAPLYAYFQREGSIMSAAYDEKNFDQLDAADEIVAFAQSECPPLLGAARARRFSSYCQVARRMQPQYLTPARRKRIDAVLRADAWSVARDGSCRVKNRAAGVLCGCFGLRGIAQSKGGNA